MAQLNDSIITGSLRVTDTIFSTNLNLSSLTASQAIVTDASKNLISRGIRNNTSVGALGWTAAATDITLVTTNTIAYWNGAYTGTTSNLSVLGTVTTGTWNATAINPNKGGTGITSYAKGDILYAGAAIAATATTALSKLAIGTAGYFLKATDNGPAWANTTDITALGTITTGTWSATKINPNKGGTGIDSYTKGDILYAGANIASTATTALSKLAIGTAGYTLQATANGPAWTQTVAVANGGTGKTSWTQWGVLYASASTTLDNTAAGIPGHLLMSNATSAPTWVNWRKHIFANKNESKETLTVIDSTWNVTSGTDVFGLAFKDTTITNDSGDWRAWLTKTGPASTALNMRIDGTWQASGFIGPLTGDVTGDVTGTATKANGLVDGSDTMTSAYNKAGLEYDNYIWLAGWNGYELRAVDKSQFARVNHTNINGTARNLQIRTGWKNVNYGSITTMSFSSAFSNACVAVIPYCGQLGFGAWSCISVSNVTKSNFQVYNYNSAAAAMTICYVAFGY